MTITGITTSLESNDLQATLDFYREVLGFAVRSTYPTDEEYTWASMERDGHGLMFTERNEHGKHAATAFTGSIYMEVRDVAALWEKVREHLPAEPIAWNAIGEAGYPPNRIAWPLETFDYGMKEFGITDPNGYLLRFGEDAET